jgi:hypothetical protein
MSDVTEACFRCNEPKGPYVRFTGGGFVCGDCAMFLPVGCENCRHHYSYHEGGTCLCNVGRQGVGMHYGPCGCRRFTAPTAAQLEERLRQDQRSVEAEAEPDVGSVFGVPPTPDPISDPNYVGYVQAGDEAAAGILTVEGAVGYDVYFGRYKGPAW